MTQRLVIALLVMIAFGAGFGARMWTEGVHVLPSPPAPGIEFVRQSAPAVAGAKSESRGVVSGSPDRAKLIADIEKVRPQIAAYHKRLDEIAAEFDRDFLSILVPEQRLIFEARQKQSAVWRATREAEVTGTDLLTDPQIEQLRRQPLWNALYSVAISWRFDRLVSDYKLDENQRVRVRRLLEARREKFIALVDSSPPPSISLSSLASRTQQLQVKAKK